MASAERSTIDRILLGEGDLVRLFRINAGAGYVGEIVRRLRDRIVLRNPRVLHAAPEGWPDLCGWTETEITPEMVGQHVAVFTAVEVKTPGVRLASRQLAFLQLVRRMGGIARVLRSDDAGRLHEERIR